MLTFNSRMIFQKEVYLLQEAGLPLGYAYGWYRRGPYSSSAAEHGFQLQALQIEELDLPRLSSEEIEVIRRFQDMFSEAVERFRDRDESNIFELLASLHFIIKYGYPRPQDTEAAVQLLIEKKPQFERDATLALEILQNHNFVD